MFLALLFCFLIGDHTFSWAGPTAKGGLPPAPPTMGGAVVRDPIVSPLPATSCPPNAHREGSTCQCNPCYQRDPDGYACSVRACPAGTTCAVNGMGKGACVCNSPHDLYSNASNIREDSFSGTLYCSAPTSCAAGEVFVLVGTRRLCAAPPRCASGESLVQINGVIQCAPVIGCTSGASQITNPGGAMTCGVRTTCNAGQETRMVPSGAGSGAFRCEPVPAQIVNTSAH